MPWDSSGKAAESTSTFCQEMKKSGNIAFGVIAILSLPVVLPVMVVRNMIEGRYQRQIADRVACERCGKLLGKAAILESDRVVADEWKQMQAKYPRVKFRRIRTHHAICTGCGQEYIYSNHGKSYLPVAIA